MSGLALFGRELRRRPLRAASRLFVEYAGYLAACFFVLLLLATRVPFRLLDRAFGVRLRERCIDAIARLSPG